MCKCAKKTKVEEGSKPIGAVRLVESLSVLLIQSSMPITCAAKRLVSASIFDNRALESICSSAIYSQFTVMSLHTGNPCVLRPTGCNATIQELEPFLCQPSVKELQARLWLVKRHHMPRSVYSHEGEISM